MFPSSPGATSKFFSIPHRSVFNIACDMACVMAQPLPRDSGRAPSATDPICFPAPDGYHDDFRPPEHTPSTSVDELWTRLNLISRVKKLETAVTILETAMDSLPAMVESIIGDIVDPRAKSNAHQEPAPALAQCDLVTSLASLILDTPTNKTEIQPPTCKYNGRKGYRGKKGKPNATQVILEESIDVN